VRQREFAENEFSLRILSATFLFQSGSPSALLKNFASGDIFRQAVAKVVMNFGEQTCSTVNSIAVPISRNFISSTNS
jgi:hypothetical protein